MATRVTCREQLHTKVDCLINLPSLYLWGPPSTGKTLVVSRVLENQEHFYEVIDCMEYFTSKMIFDCVINKLNETIYSSSDYASVEHAHIKIDNNPPLFIKYLKNLIQKAMTIESNFVYYLIFKNADRLPSIDPSLLPFLLLLPEKLKQSVKVVFISRLPYEQLDTKGELVSHSPVSLMFSNYTDREMTQIMLESTPYDMYGIYPEFCKAIVCGVTNVHRCYTQVSKFAKQLWPKYEELHGEFPDKPMIRWKKFHDHLKDILTHKIDTNQTTVNKVSRQDIELPYFAKYLLIAAYIASFNPPKSDMRFFMTDTGKLSKRAKHAQKSKQQKLEDNLHLMGPKSFTRERWLIIFESMLKGRYRPSLNLQALLSTLTSLDLVVAQKSSSDTSLFIPDKFTVNVNLDLVDTLAQSVQFPLKSFLVDLQENIA